MGYFTNKKNLNFKKFIKELSSKREWLTPKGKRIGYEDINIALEKACGGRENFKECDDLMRGVKTNSLLLLTDEYIESEETQFKRIDNSFVYKRIMQIMEGGDEHTDPVYNEYAYLSSSKTDKSFLMKLNHFRSNYDFETIKVFNKINKKNLKNISNIILKYYDFENPNCNRVVFNSDFNWKIPDLKKKFLKSAKEREKLQTMFIMEGETDERTDDQKKVHLHFLNGKQICRYYDFSSSKFKKGKNNHFIKIKNK